MASASLENAIDVESIVVTDLPTSGHEADPQSPYATAPRRRRAARGHPTALSGDALALIPVRSGRRPGCPMARAIP